MKVRALVLMGLVGAMASLAGRAEAGLVSYTFTAADENGHIGTGSFSYESTMGSTVSGFSSRTYTAASGQAPITINFTSDFGTFNATQMGRIIVNDGFLGSEDYVQIEATSPELSAKSSFLTIEFADASNAALSSSALPTSIDLAAFPTYHALDYYDAGVNATRVFTITSLTSGAAPSVPEPSSLALCGIAGAIALATLRTRRARVA